jgi:glycosyltransferase involved in cell wall biosynthesis
VSTASARKVVVLNQFALPRSEGGGTRHVELFSRLRGWAYLIVAGNRHTYTRQKYVHGTQDFVTVPVAAYARNGPARVLNWLSYVPGALWAGLRQRRLDAVYASSPHLVTPLAGWILARIRRVPFVLEIRDLWPRSLVELGFLRAGSGLHRVLTRLEGFLYRAADRIVVVTEGWEAHLASFGVRPEQVVVVSNGADPADFVPSVSRDVVRSKLGVAGCVVVYAGAHGPANGLDQVLDVARELSDVTFVLVGDGLEKARLVARAREEDLGNVAFLDPVPKADLADLLVGCDVGLHTLAEAELFKQAMSPNKLYDYLAAGLPVITNVGGRLERRLVEAGCAVAGSARDEQPATDALAAAIRDLAGRGDEERAQMGADGRRFVERSASRIVMAARLEQVLDDVVAAP